MSDKMRITRDKTRITRAPNTAKSLSQREKTDCVLVLVKRHYWVLCRATECPVLGQLFRLRRTHNNQPTANSMEYTSDLNQVKSIRPTRHK